MFELGPAILKGRERAEDSTLGIFIGGSSEARAFQASEYQRVMARHALIPALILGVAMTVLAEETAIGGAAAGQTYAAGRDSNGGRRLQSTTYNFATQLEMTVCLSTDHSTDAASSTPDEVTVQ